MRANLRKWTNEEGKMAKQNVAKLMATAVLATLIGGMTGWIPPARGAEFRSAWPEGVERVWIGPEYFANRMLDWRVANGRLECVEGRKAKPMRSVHLLTQALNGEPGTLEMSVRTGPI
ncbi:hypothetical protein AMJ85_04410, partial [candidate division BRC1 bacterium SM23_51]